MRSVKTDTVIKTTARLELIERKYPARGGLRAKVEYVIFKRGPTAMEEVWRGRGGGHTTRSRAFAEFERQMAIECWEFLEKHGPIVIAAEHTNREEEV